MTACKDSQATSGKKAVSATLAGVLAVGLVPAVALADEAVEVTEEDGITERIVTPAQAFAAGTWTKYWDGAEKTLAAGASIAVAYTGSAVTVIPQSIQVESAAATGGQIDVPVSASGTMSAGYTVKYYAADANGNKTGAALASVVKPGRYVAEVTADSTTPYAGGVAALPFTVSAGEFDDSTIVVYEVNPKDASDVTDTSFMFTGNNLSVGVTLDDTAGTTLKQGTDYTVKFLPAHSSVDAPGVTIRDAGSYYAVITGVGTYAGQFATTSPFTVAPFDLSAATIAPITVVNSNAIPSVASVKAADGTELNPSLVKLTDIQTAPPTPGSAGTAAGDKVFNLLGTYTFSVMPVTLPNANFADPAAAVKPGTATVTKVGAAATYKYNGAALPSTFNTNLSDMNSAAFNVNNIEVLNGATKLTVTTNYTVTVTKDGAAYTVPADGLLDEAGVYEVTVATKPDSLSYAVGGEAKVTVTVTEGTVNADASAYINYNGAPISSLTVPYDGTGIAQNAFTPVVVLGDKELTAGTDYKMIFTDAEGKDITGAGNLVNAGTYTITLEGITCTITGNKSIIVTISKVDLTQIQLSGTGIEASAFDKNYSYIDTTSAVTLDSSLVKYNAEADKTADPDWQALPAGVDATWQMKNDEGEWETATTAAQDSTGEYRVVLTPSTDTVKANYTFASDEGTIVYISAGLKASFVFADVTPGSWYFDVVAQAKADSLMNGYNGTDLFGPNDTITRGQVACVLFNMAGGSSSMDDSQYDENKGWVSFSDVDGKMYYGQAIAWAKNAGVVHGYAGTDDFRPDATITREEFAAMLANYAVKNGSALPSDVDALLADKSDGSTVSDWAKASVAWAVQNKVMGNGGFIAPFSNTTRAETAAMVVNYDNSVK